MQTQGLKILASLIMGFCLASPSAFAAGAAPLAAPIAPPPKAGKPMQEVPMPGSGEHCTNEYKKASAYFQSVLGEDATFERISAFEGEYKSSIKTSNKIIDDGSGTVFLKVSMSLGPIPIPAPLTVPVRVCKLGNRLTAVILMGAAVFNQPNGTQSSIKNLIKDIPEFNEVSITRNAAKQIEFKSITNPEQPPSIATVR